MLPAALYLELPQYPHRDIPQASPAREEGLQTVHTELQRRWRASRRSRSSTSTSRRPRALLRSGRLPLPVRVRPHARPRRIRRGPSRAASTGRARHIRRRRPGGARARARGRARARARAGSLAPGYLALPCAARSARAVGPSSTRMRARPRCGAWRHPRARSQAARSRARHRVLIHPAPSSICSSIASCAASPVSDSRRRRPALRRARASLASAHSRTPRCSFFLRLARTRTARGRRRQTGYQPATRLRSAPLLPRRRHTPVRTLARQRPMRSAVWARAPHIPSRCTRRRARVRQSTACTRTAFLCERHRRRQSRKPAWRRSAVRTRMAAGVGHRAVRAGASMAARLRLGAAMAAERPSPASSGRRWPMP